MAIGDGVTWSESKPDNDTVAHQIDDYDRDLRVGVRSRMAREHIWPAAQTATNEGGHHTFVTFQAQTAAPTMAGTTAGSVWVGTDKALYFTDSAGTDITLVTASGRLDDSMPIGGITMYASSGAPTNWLLCNGAAVSRSTYAVLFGVCSTVYGTGDGTNTFNIPDLTDRFVLGAGSTYSMGASGGAATHVHSGTSAALNISTTRLDDNSGGSDVDWMSPNNHTHTITISATTGMPPYVVAAYIIRAL